MKERRLGKKFTISEIGLGCWQFGGDFGSSGVEQANAILKRANRESVNFFDTADVYGGGKSESFIGDFLNKENPPIVVATKYGRRGDVYPDNYTEESLRKCIESSSNNLGVKQIDLLQLHCIPLEVLREGKIFDLLRKVQSEGLIGAFGASVETVEEGLVCLEQDGLTSLQVIFNVFRQSLTEVLLPKAHEKGVGIIVRLPLASGLLTGKYKKDTEFEARDHRNYNKDGEAFSVGETFSGIPFSVGVDLVEELKQFIPNGYTPAQFALRWILDHDAVSTIIAGASTPEQAAANASVSAMPPLSVDVHKRLAQFYRDKVKQHIRGRY